MNGPAAQHRVEFADITAAMRLARINVALARLRAFEDECFRLGELIYDDAVRRREIVDFLEDLATANGLIAVEGPGLIHNMIAAGVRGGA